MIMYFPCVSEFEVNKGYLYFNRAPAMECSTRKSLWYDPVECLQNQRGKRSSHAVTFNNSPATK